MNSALPEREGGGMAEGGGVGAVGRAGWQRVMKEGEFEGVGWALIRGLGDTPVYCHSSASLVLSVHRLF